MAGLFVLLPILPTIAIMLRAASIRRRGSLQAFLGDFPDCIRTFHGRPSEPTNSEGKVQMVSDAKTSPAFDSDARQAATLAIDALSKWRNELTTANDRWLRKVLDQMSVVARALDWPDDVLNGTREHLLNASRMQAQIIDQFIDIWSGHLKSTTGLKAVPPTLHRTQGAPPRGLSGPLGMGGMSFAPMDFWVQAAETWQRNWASAISLWVEALPMSHTNEHRERSRTLSGRRSN